MKRIILLIPVFWSISLLAQNSTKLSVFSTSDSSAIADASVEIRFLNKKNKNLKTQSNQYGIVEFSVPENINFNLLVSKEGFKSFFTTVTTSQKEIIIFLNPLIFDAEEITVMATRSGILNTATQTNLTKKDIVNRDFAQDIPTILQTLPSTVSTSDAGAGIGYSGITIRGTDATRINVTINGVPLNDAESQGVYWVDLPDLSGGTENIQVQRGVGTSTNGAAAFGASINIKTDKFSETPFTKLSISAGSFNTSKQTLKIGTGKMKNNWYSEGRISWIQSEGFIDRASSNLKSFSFTTGHKTSKSLFQVLIFLGNEKTYQAWNGVPLVKFKNNVAETDSFISFLWYDSIHASQLKLSNSNTYNYYLYKNETDNYTQSHFQLIYNLKLNKNRYFNFVLHGTGGKGYYENYEYKTDLSQYIDTPAIWYGNKYYYSDLVRQRWLDNKFVGFVFSLNQTKSAIEQIIGGGFNIYKGKHFGNVIWYEFINMKNGAYRYYNNNSTKTDANMFWKMQYRYSKKLSFFTDLQLRNIYYNWFGPDVSGTEIQQNKTYWFFNPKAGLQYNISSKKLIYLTYGRASREPVRDDFINSSRRSLPKPEFLDNVELGFKEHINILDYSITAYYMRYKNQLALSGKINDVGSYTRTNIDNSYRAGIEFETRLDISPVIEWKTNLTFSQNKILEFKEFVDDWSNGGQTEKNWKNTDMVLSPNVVFFSQLLYKPFKNFNISLNTKYVGRQYLDNTQTQSRSIDPYRIEDLILLYNLKLKNVKNVNLGLMINNIGNYIYASNGYVFSGMINNSRKDFSFVYPQAGTNFIARMIIDF